MTIPLYFIVKVCLVLTSDPTLLACRLLQWPPVSTYNLSTWELSLPKESTSYFHGRYSFVKMPVTQCTAVCHCQHSTSTWELSLPKESTSHVSGLPDNRNANFVQTKKMEIERHLSDLVRVTTLLMFSWIRFLSSEESTPSFFPRTNTHLTQYHISFSSMDVCTPCTHSLHATESSLFRLFWKHTQVFDVKLNMN